MNEVAEYFDIMKSEQMITEACDHVSHIRRPVYTFKCSDSKNNLTPTVGRSLILFMLSN